jgi:hypothetical protein
MVLYLAPRVYAAEVDRDLVLLDARRNQFWCIPASRATAALQTLHDPPHEESSSLHPEVQDLMAEGLFVFRPGMTPVEAPPIPDARTDIFRDESFPRLNSRELLLALTAGMITLVKLTLLPPAWWLKPSQGIRAVRRHCASQRSVSLARGFERLRPLLPGTALCLARSMLLLEFLRLNGIHANWIFGVRTRPFSAHCWVQAGETVLNDSVDHVRWFTPIAMF